MQEEPGSGKVGPLHRMLSEAAVLIQRISSDIIIIMWNPPAGGD